MKEQPNMTEKTPDILQEIMLQKHEELIQQKRKTPQQELKHRADDQPDTRDFNRALQKTIAAGKSAVIAELKKASPSKGVICQDFIPEKIAELYEKGGASCLSVLTDVVFFQGSHEFLQRAKGACALPVLRKDFICDLYQVYESRVLGADCILLIATILSDMQMQDFSGLAQELDMDVLVEVHNREELERSFILRLPLIGINNRNLHTFVTDIETTIDLLVDMPQDRTVITESGIHTTADVQKMRQHGVHCFLVGEALISSDEPGKKLAELFSD